MILVTGGAGFIGSNFVLDWLRETGEPVVNLDKLTYAGNPENLAGLKGDKRHDLRAGRHQRRCAGGRAAQAPHPACHRALRRREPRRPLDPRPGRVHRDQHQRHLHAARGGARALVALDGEAKAAFRFLHVSTDEVYGSLGDDPAFAETHPYQPNSPYSASKAASDHLVRAYHHTYGLPTLTTNCSNNYGPFQFPEKLIPLMILNAIAGKPLPIYGDGLNVRDWLYVGDHCSAIRAVLAKGRLGETYNIGGRAEMTNLAVVKTLCSLLDRLHPGSPVTPHEKLVTYVKDRPGHDRRYAMNADKLERELGWRPAESFESGIEKTVRWYLDNTAWTGRVASGAYRDWVAQHYSD
jgi:dTDP-glucose 4,6-dehydratase